MNTEMVKLLIVDDEIGIRNGLKNFINWEQEGYEIINDVANGTDALKEIILNKPDIIISDIVMPEMDGVSLMKNLNKLYPEIAVIILSSYDDFKYVKTVMQYGADDYLLKATLTPIELLSMLKKIVSQRRIKGQLSNKKDSSKNIQRFLNNFSTEKEINDLNNYLKETNNYLVLTEVSRFSNVEQEKKEIHEIFQTHLKKGDISTFFLETKIVIVLKTSLTKNQIKDFLKLVTELLILKHSHLFFVYSQPIHSSAELKRSFTIIFDSINQERFIRKNKSLVSIKNLTTVVDLSTFDTKQYLLKLTNHKFDDALEYLNYYFSKNINNPIDEESLRNLATNTIYNFISSLEEFYGENSSLAQLKLNIFSSLNSITYLEDFMGVFNDICYQLMNFIDTIIIPNQIDLAQKIEYYIREHSSEKITLKEMADKFHFSYSYLSSFFSSSMNESFNDFLNRIRIDKSCQMLKESNLNISEISQEVGYSDVSYFSKVFKKIKGQSPMKYRRGKTYD